MNEVNYSALRQNAVLYAIDFKIYQLPEGDDSLDLLSKVVSGRTMQLEPNKVLHTLILDATGTIADIVYIMMYDAKFIILSSADDDRCIKILNSYQGNIEVTDCSKSFGILSVEGPFSWKVMKSLFGLEIIGLTYLRFMETALDAVPVTLLRAGMTGEYGYRLLVDNANTSAILERIKGFSEFPITQINEPGEVKELLRVASAEIRFPVLDGIVHASESPIDNELRWMIDFRKKEYIGKQIIDEYKNNYLHRTVGIQCDTSKSDSIDTVKSKDVNIYLEETVVGKIKELFFSPYMKKYVGYGIFEKEWGYAGITEYHVTIGGKKIGITTASTPFFLTESNRIQME